MIKNPEYSFNAGILKKISLLPTKKIPRLGAPNSAICFSCKVLKALSGQDLKG
jgi:hypothetical protein